MTGKGEPRKEEKHWLKAAARREADFRSTKSRTSYKRDPKNGDDTQTKKPKKPQGANLKKKKRDAKASGQESLEKTTKRGIFAKGRGGGGEGGVMREKNYGRNQREKKG